MAWLDSEGRFEVVILQETHWRDSTDFRSGRWYCIHSSGYGSEVSYDRFGGVLVMLRQEAFEEPSVQELYPGRLLHVRAVHKQSNLTVDVLGIYQHVHRTHLPPEQNQAYRQHIWDTLSRTLKLLPSRNPLLLGGDFNAQLAKQHPHVGAANRSHDAGQDRDRQFQKLLGEHDLCALNTWHCRPGYTYESAHSKTRIDFVLTRLRDAKSGARQAAPNYAFPIKSWMAAGHWPIEATLQVVPFSRRGEPVTAPTAARYDKVALLHSVHADTPQAVALKEEIAQALQAVTATELHQVRDSVNRILLEAVERRFPLGRPDDTRVSAQGSFRASAKSTWQLYRELKVHRAATPHAVFRQWRAATAFLKASKALRAQSRHLKQTAILEKLAEAEAAACKGDQRTLHQIVRSLTPNKRQFMSRLRDKQGHLLDKPASLQAMLQYARDTFSIYPDAPTGACIQQGVPISDQQVQATLQKLGAAKAVPYNTAPAAIWKLCAGSIAGLLGPALRLHFQAYDFASRPIIYETLAKHGVSQDTIAVIQQLHTDAQYVFRAGANVGRHTTTNGLKQGCCIAPFLWSFFTVAVMHSLRDKLGQDWLHQALVLFADDHWCQWVIRSKADFEQSVQQLQVVLETLMDFRMSINFKKTAILCRLEGKQAKSVLRDHIKLRNGDKFFSVQVRGQEQLIPIRAVHDHLGTKVTYHHRLDANMEHRIQSGQAKYQALRKTLNGHHTLQVQHRLRLWAACVQTSIHYSLAAVGVTRAGLDKLTKITTKHLRAIQRQPVHLTRTTNEQVLQSANLLPPGQVLLRSLQRFRESLNLKAVTAPDITTRTDVCAYVERLEANWQHLVDLQQQQDAQLPIIEAAVPCPYCDACFTTENAMRIHAQLAHQNLPPRAACNPTKFVPRQHATGGLPVCRLMTDVMQGLNPEADIFAFCNPSLLTSRTKQLALPKKEEKEEMEPEREDSTQPPKRPRPEPSPLFSASPQTGSRRPQHRQPRNTQLSAEGKLLARALLHHEDQLAAQRMDKDFVLFMRQDYASIIPNLHAISTEWHAKKEEGHEGLTSSLRTVLLACLVKELLARVQNMASTTEGQGKLQAVHWLDSNQAWTFLRWCHKSRKLVLDNNKESLSHTELVRQLTFLLENLRGDIIHKFHSTKGLDLVEENTSSHPSVTFLLGISLRGEKANEMHEVLCKLLGCSMWQLIG
ncbi:unnamed protein product, partial [Symbiodinium microadriaticum]